jgi:hypothetical protein
MAIPGVGTLALRTINRRTTAVSIDGATPFTLPSALAALLLVLATGPDRDADGFPPFRSHAALAALYSAATGRSIHPHAIVVGLRRLQDKLWTLGHVTPYLVERVRRRGARFRLRGAAPLAE